MTRAEAEVNIGKKCQKKSINERDKFVPKAFKSRLKVNTIKGVIEHPILIGELAYTFVEDESYVECRRCEVIEDVL